MNKSLKALFMASMLPVMMLMAAVTLTSCEGTLDDIFGEWSRPTGQQNNEPTKEELLSDLSSALEEGAIVTITYTIDGVEYISTFKRVGEEYIEQSTTPAASTRAIGTGSDYPKTRVYIVKNGDNGEDIMRMEVDINYMIQLDVSVNVKKPKTTTNYSKNKNTLLSNVLVNYKKVNLKKIAPHSVDIMLENNQLLGEVYYFTGESWSDVTTASQENGGKYLQIDSKANQVIFTANNYSGYLVYEDGTTIDPSDIVGSEDDVYYLKKYSSFVYKELSWDATINKVVASEKGVTKFDIVTSSQTGVDWNKGTYVVNQDVTINGKISLNGDVKLILCDDCTLTVNGEIYGNGEAFTIYGQARGTGKLSITNNPVGLCYFSDFVIHGGNVESSTKNNHTFNLKMYGGKFTAKSYGSAPTIDTYTDNNMTIYGGELEAISDNSNAILVGEENNFGTLTVYGGKVTAKAPNGQAIKCKFAKGEGITDIVFSESDNGTEWTETAANVSDKRYFKAEEGVPTYNPTDEEINELYAKLVERTVMDKTVLSGMNIKLLVEDVAAETETITEAYAKPLAEKICTEKSLSGVVLFIGGDETNGYEFYYMSGSTNSKTHLASTAAIPDTWENLTLFYVKKSTSSE